MREVLIRLPLFLWETQERDCLELRTTLLMVKSTGIVTIAEKGVAFLLLEIAKENIQLVHQRLFTEAYFVLVFRVFTPVVIWLHQDNKSHGTSCYA